VLHDVTTRTWVLRHITRSLVQFAPFAIVLFLVIPVDRVILGVGLGMGR
jgi:ABC-type methionine transport system permease subunit